MKVIKFGGSSLADSYHIKNAVDIIMSDPDRRIVVVSAPGKRNKQDNKVTDLLINLANACIHNQDVDKSLSMVLERYREIVVDLNLPQDVLNTVEEDLRGRIGIVPTDKHRYMDLIKAAGEDNIAKVFTSYLQSLNINAKYVNPKDAGLILSNEHGNARVLPESFKNLEKLREVDYIAVFPGFFGYSPSGNLVTFPRGGSDITGAILAAAVKADLYENFTDVDFVFSANPEIVDNPKPIYSITFREMRELSYAGFSVLHEETLEPVYRMKIPVCIKSVNNPLSRGTLIMHERKKDGNPVVGIASATGFCTIFISKYMMNREIGFSRKILSILEEEGIPYEHAPSGIDHISFIVKEEKLTPESEERIIQRIKNELNADRIDIEKGVALIMLAGEGMLKLKGLMSRATNALFKVGVNIEMINQGLSDISMMFGVRKECYMPAVKALYNEFFN